MKMAPNCLRCGRCCILKDGKPCNYLVYFVDMRDHHTKTFCIIYAHRIGSVLRTGELCLPRDAKKQGNKMGCPYNEKS